MQRRLLISTLVVAVVAVLLLGVLMSVADEDDPAALIRTLLAPFPAGSFLAVSNVTLEGALESAPAAIKVLDRSGIGVHPRTRDQLRALLAGLELVEPGLVWAPEWRPDPGTEMADPAPAPAPAHPSKPTAVSAAEVRAWAKENGLDVPARGRLRPEIWDKYRAAHLA